MHWIITRTRFPWPRRNPRGLPSTAIAPRVILNSTISAAEECTSVLELDYDHTGALMLRAQTLVTLKEYHSALFDVNRLIDLNPSSEVYRNLQTRLKTQLSLAPIPEEETESEEEEDHYTDEAKLEENETKQEDSNNNAEKFESRENDASESQNIVPITENAASQSQTNRKTTTDDQQTTGWKTIPKPKGHSNLDYSRWDRVENDSSDEDDDEDDDDSDDDDSARPQYRFRVKNVGVKAVK
ncbi:hypothetical protein ABFS83_08G159900 [Erythranthe nasuta]